MAITLQVPTQVYTQRTVPQENSTRNNNDGQSLVEQLLSTVFQQIFDALRPTDASQKPTSMNPSNADPRSPDGPSPVSPSSNGEPPKGMLQSFEDLLRWLREAMNTDDPSQNNLNNPDSPSPDTSQMNSEPGNFSPSSPAPNNLTSNPATESPSNQPLATNLQDAAARTQPKFQPVLRGDEATKDAQIQTQADFGKAVDEVAREYGLDPNLFRAQLQSESSAFTNGFREAMRAEGDLDRAGENNTSIGLGQISRKFLDGREWADGGPGNERMGKQEVSTDQYLNSPTVQLRMAASNLAQRVADEGGLQNGLAYYVSGNPDPSNPKAAAYLANIERAMKDPNVVDVGR